jgi:hypothetical protein
VCTALRCYRQNEVASYVYALTIWIFAPPPPTSIALQLVKAKYKCYMYVLMIGVLAPCCANLTAPRPLLLYTKSLNQVLFVSLFWLRAGNHS